MVQRGPSTGWVLADTGCPSRLREAEPAAPHRPPSPDPPRGSALQSGAGSAAAAEPGERIPNLKRHRLALQRAGERVLQCHTLCPHP